MSDELENRVRCQELDVQLAQRQYQAKVESARHGVRRIIAAAREELSRLKADRDEARIRLARERETLALYKKQADVGYES